MSRSTAAWFAGAGILAVVRWVLDYTDPSYYDAASLLDYSAVVSQTLAMVATGIALILLWRDPPVRRGSFFLLVGGVGAIAQGLGNLVEDVFDIEAGFWAFAAGSIVMLVSLFAAGVAELTVRSPRRWSGLFLIGGAVGGLLGVGLLIMGVAWVLFSGWIVFTIARSDQPSGRSIVA